MASFTLRLEDDHEDNLKVIMDNFKRSAHLSTKTKAIQHLINTYSSVSKERDDFKAKYQQALSKLRDLENLINEKSRIEQKVQEYFTQA